MRVRVIIIVLIVVMIGFGSRVMALPFESRITKGNRYYNQGNFEKAEAEYKSANTKKPSLISVFNLGSTFYKQGRFDESETVFGLLTAEAVPKKIRENSFYNSGNAEFRQARYDDAIRSYEEALRIDPQDEDARYNLEVAKQMKKNPPKKKPDQQKQPAQPKQQPQNKSGLKREDAERLLQGIGNDEKHQPKRFKAGQGGGYDW